MISKKAKIGSNVTIEEYAIIRDDVEIGNNVVIGSCVKIDNGARIADDVKIHHGAVVSTIPQDLKFKNEYTLLKIGKGTVVREFASLNRSTGVRPETVIGENCFIMANAHVAHDCIVGNNVIMANSCALGGHVEIGDFVILGGLSGVHQFSKIGAHAMVSALSYVNKDVPPFIVAGKKPLQYEGLNIIGLKRRGFTSERIEKIKSVYDVIYRSQYNVSDALKKIKDSFETDDDVNLIVDFIESSSRGIIK